MIKKKATAGPKKAAEAAELFPRSTLPLDILQQPMPDPIPQPSSRRIGVHLSTSGGVSTAIERARRVGANTLQIFSSSPRMWRGMEISADEAAKVRELRREYDIGPLVIHANYLINCCSQTGGVRQQSVVALRGELERALQLEAEFLVLHPGSWRGMTRAEGLEAAAESIEEAFAEVKWKKRNFNC
jgi:deoxyribonuclease-4